MVDDREALGDPLAAFRVERVVRSDGRYLLYYSWPEAPATDADATPPAARGSAEAQQPWTPEAGPAADDRTDI